MIALDSNVLLRYLVQDDAAQTAQAAALINRAIKSNQLLFVAEVAVCEIVWVLRARYDFGRSEIAGALRNLLRARHLAFGATDQLVRALNAYERGQGDFADYLIREQARAADYSSVATFDKVLLQETGFVSVK